MELLKNETIQQVKIIVEKIQIELSKKMPDTIFSFSFDDTDTQIVYFNYPRAFNEENYHYNGYVQPRITLEFGSRGGFQPTTPIKIKSYIDEFLMGQSIIKQSHGSKITTMNVERTFFEKVTAIHAYLNNINSTIRNSFARHYYDIHMIASKVDVIKTDKNVFEQVVKDKILYFKNNSACYEAILKFGML